MDITVSIRDGWALVTETDTGRTAVCIPEVTPDRMTFHMKGWHDSYEDAFLVIAAMDALGVSINDYVPEEGHEEDQGSAGQITSSFAHRVTAAITAVAHGFVRGRPASTG